MAKFRTKPVVKEAIRATGTPRSNREIIDWTRDSITPACMDKRPDENGLDYYCLSINTLEGSMWVNSGDWIVKGVNGEFYPCKPDVFEKTYEPVGD